MGSWAAGMTGALRALGEHQQQQTMLDMQMEKENRERMAGLYEKLIMDPNIIDQPEVKDRFMQALQAIRTTPLHKKISKEHMDLQSLLTVESTSGVPAKGQPISYPGPPKEEGGPADYSNMQIQPAQPIPGEPGIAGRRSIFKSDEETARSEAYAAGLKAEATYPYQLGIKGASSTNPVDSRVLVLGRNLKARGIQEVNGVPVDDNSVYQELRHRNGATEYSDSVAVRYSQGPREASGAPTSYDPYNRTVSDVATPEGMVFEAPTTRILHYDAPSKTFYENKVDSAMNLRGPWVASATPSGYLPQTTESRTYKQVGNSWVIVSEPEVTTRTPAVGGMGTTPFPGAQGPTTQAQPSTALPIPPLPTEPKWGAPGEPSKPPTTPTAKPSAKTTVRPTERRVTPSISVTKIPAQPSTLTPLSARIAQKYGSTAQAVPSVPQTTPAAQPQQQSIADPSWNPDDKDLNKALQQPELSPNFKPNILMLSGEDLVPLDETGATLQDQLRTAGDVRYGQGGKQIFMNQRALTGQQVLQARANRRVFDTTADLLSQLAAPDTIKILNSMLNRVKLTIGSDPRNSSQFIVSALSWLDPKEAKVKVMLDRIAAVKMSSMEHVQTIRTPLGAAGFRSLEAFRTLQIQAGNLMSRPEITRHVLQNTLKTVLALRSVYDYADYYNQSLSGRYRPMVPTSATIRQFRIAYNESGDDTVDDWALAKAAMKEFGYSPPTPAKKKPPTPAKKK